MPRPFACLQTSAIALLVASPAFADVTAPEVWESWKSFLETTGQSVSVGSEDYSGGVLTLSDVTTLIDFPEEAGGGSSTIGEVVLTERDGEVDVTVSPEYRTLLSLKDGTSRVEMTLVTRHTGFDATVSGTPDAMTYRFDADEMSFAVEELIADGVPQDVEIVGTLTDLAGTYLVGREGTVSTIEQSLSMASASFTVSGAPSDPTGDAPEQIDLTMNVTGLAGQYSASFPDDMDDMAEAELFAAGLALSGALTYTGADMTMDVKDENETVNFKGEMGAGNLGMGISAEGFEYAQAVRALSATIKAVGTSSYDPFDIDGTFRLDQASGRLDFDFPDTFDDLEGADLLRAGFGGNGTFEISGFDLAANGTADGEDIEFAMAVEATGGGFGMGLDGIYSTQDLTNFTFSMTAADIPVDRVEVSLPEARSRLHFPATATDTPEDFEFTFAYRDMTMSESLWSLFDPGAQLPRDPATFALATTGKMRWLVDFMHPEAMNDPSAEPVEVTELSLNELVISAMGASLTGDGALSFDYTDTTTFDGMPRPTGEMNFTLTGVGGLTQTLIDMGLLPAREAMGFRMMLGIFARPGEGEDVMVSKIEMTEDGQVLANGMPLPMK